MKRLVSAVGLSIIFTVPAIAATKQLDPNIPLSLTVGQVEKISRYFQQMQAAQDSMNEARSSYAPVLDAINAQVKAWNDAHKSIGRRPKPLKDK